jgi:alpha-mannosidase
MEGKVFHVVGADHIDLAWKKGSGEMAELQESFLVRLLDLLERNPRFTYVVEQASHFRRLEDSRPDLVGRLERFVREGRVEVVGCMASTMETNLPCGEAFVRNQLLGARWFRERFGVEPAVGWLIDTFGTNAQVPQILRQFGVRFLMANRLGGEKTHDVFHAVGLDGSTVLVAGRDTTSPRIHRARVHWRFARTWDVIDGLFQSTESAEGEGPHLVVPYLENEYLPSARVAQQVERREGSSRGVEYRFSLPRQFFDALERSGLEFPTEPGDLNPEFTGCFSQRIALRLANRRAEGRLLEAEMWAALLGGSEAAAKRIVDDAWWTMAFNQFHDVFTGSHPTSVMVEVLDNFAAVERHAAKLLGPHFPPLPSLEGAGDGVETTIAVVNSLPWPRRDLVSVPFDGAGRAEPRVSCGGTELPCAFAGGRLRFAADVPAAGVRRVTVRTGKAGAVRPGSKQVESAVIENEWIRLELDRSALVRALVWKPTGARILENAGDLLVLQKDDGNFQFEMPVGSEMHAAGGDLSLERAEDSPLESRAVLSGEFPGPEGSLGGPAAKWSVTASIRPGVPKVDLGVDVDWRGEGCRLRLKLPTLIDSAGGIYEVPFGAVRRRVYAPGSNRKGEWPAQRFVALEDREHGLALLNTGVAGVECAGGTLWTTLLRAPRNEYAGMVPDATSSQHGSHSFLFALVPYQGRWHESPVLRLAQELNSPLFASGVGASTPSDGLSVVGLDGDGVVLAAVKFPEDGARDEIVARLYEATGRSRDAVLSVRGATEGWLSDLRESRGEPLERRGESFRIPLGAFQIKTVRLRK